MNNFYPYFLSLNVNIFSSYCLFVLARISCTILIKNSDTMFHFLIPNLRVESFDILSLIMMFAYGFNTTCYHNKKIPFYF